MELKIDNIEGSNFATASNVYQIYDTTNNSDVFELVIDGLILEKYADEDVKEYIKNLPSNKKRVATLSLIGEDNLLWTKINEIIKEEKSSYERLKSVYTLLKEYVKIADVERKKHGEILTPFKELAEPMVKLVEKYDPEFWKNKNHKVLDSSAGYGTFLILSAYKFMVGLKDEFPDEEQRFKWIVENCLYYGELQAKSVFSWLVAIDPHNEYKTNIYWGSFLTKDFDDHMNNVWKVESFDLIIQNPPYQTREDGNTKTKPIWHLFVQKSLTLLKEDKYMIMVHPDGWRSNTGIFKETQELLRGKEMLYLEVHDKNEGFKIFGATTTYDFYCLRNTENKNFITEIRCVNGEFEKVDISKMEFIPNGMFNDYKNLVAKDGEEKVNFIHSYSAYEHRKSHMSVIETEVFKYPCIYYTYKDESVRLMYSNTDTRGHFGVPKIIWSYGGASTPIIDKTGEYGQVEFAYSIVDSVDNLENIKKAMMTDRFIKIMSLSDGTAGVGGQRYNSKIISTFRKDFWKDFINEPEVIIEKKKLIIGNKYTYIGNSKKILKDNVEIITLSDEKAKVKDTNGQVLEVSISKLKKI